MLGTAPPYALTPILFHFPALAACAGRAPLGGDRELAMGVLTSARLAQALLPPITLEHDLVVGRADRAKRWAMGLAMPNPARMALLRALDATATGPLETADALAELTRTVNGHIDAASQAEVDHLIAQLRLYYDGIVAAPANANTNITPNPIKPDTEY